MTVVADWLFHLADPLGPKKPQPRRRLSAAQARELFVQAECHGVLAAALRHFEFPRDSAEFDAIRDAAFRSHHQAVGFSLMLRQHGNALMQAVKAQELPAIVIKGPVFARRLYPDPALRRFTDIDILAAPEAVRRLAELLSAMNFELADQAAGPDPQEWKWLHREHRDVMIEVQCNLIHAAALRTALSLRYVDLVPDNDRSEAECPAALLLVATVHAAGHHFERLVQVVDICQAARNLRTAKDQQRLEELILQTQSRMAAVTGLTIAGRLFEEPDCLNIAKAIGPVRFAAIGTALIDRSVVGSTMTRNRYLHSWRRAAYRELLKRGI